MRAITITASHEYQDGAVVQLTIRDGSSGLPIETIIIERDAIGHLIAGEIVEGFAEASDAPVGPTMRETMEQHVEAPILPDEKESRATVITGLLRHYEKFGWKGNARHVGDKNRVVRELPGGRVIYRVEFERYVPEPARRG
jgi:hypothetical protein